VLPKPNLSISLNKKISQVQEALTGFSEIHDIIPYISKNFRQKKMPRRHQPTYRPQNMCWSCFYTWYPRGKNYSLSCPHCGSERVGENIFTILAILFVATIALCIYFWYITLPALAFLIPLWIAFRSR